MQNQENKLNNIGDLNDSQNKMNIKNPKIKTNNLNNSPKDIRNPNFQEQQNLPKMENYLKRNSPMQSIKTMFNLNLKKDENNNIINQNNSFYQDFSPKIDNNFIPLTPQIVPNDQKHLNKKFFPSKANVCKGNPDSNPKFIIPSSSPIVQYFASHNVDNMLNGDLGFSLENGNSNIYGERISHLSNVSQSDMFNFSPSEFFNRNSHGMSSDKNIDGFLMNEPEGGGEDEKNKLPTEEEEELCAVELEMGNLDLNYKEDDNSILNKINEMKNKKQKEKNNINNAKGHRNTHNNKNNNHRKIKKKENQNDSEFNKSNENKKKANNKSKEKIYIQNNNKSIINEKNINENLNSNVKENSTSNNNKDSISPKPKSKDNQSSNEENNHGGNNQNISTEFTKKLEDYLETPFDENSIQNKEKNIDIKKEDILNKNINNKNNIPIDNINNINNLETENKKNNFNRNNTQVNNNINNLNINNINNSMNNKNMSNNIDKNNLNYINGMNIRCTNLNINNFTNLNNNSQTGNYYDSQSQQQILKYLQNQNNPNYLMLNQNPNFINNNEIYNLNNNIPNMNNYNNNIYNNLNGMNLYNMNLMNNQMNSINQMNINPFYMQNNLIQGYPYFSNNTNHNNFNIDLKKNKQKNNYVTSQNLINNNRMIMNNNINNSINNVNQLNNDPKKKKIKRLETSSYMDKPLSFIAENFGMMGKDQGACRYIQKLLNDNPKESINSLYIPICKNVLQLINDPFGNYLIQKIITLLNDEQLYEIIKIISPFFFEICCNTHGTRVLQKFVEHSKAPKVKDYFFELLKPLITPLLKQLNGTFVVQKFAEVNSKEYGQEINEIIVENSPVLSTHRHGCCVIQKYLELKDPIMTPNLLNKLIDNCLLLIVDQFGNYVIQTILLMGDKRYGNRLAEKIAENVVYYAKHKYSSNVVEKCFDYCDGIYLQNLMNNVQKKDNLTELILDEHGNYVVQKVLALSKPNIQRGMLRIIVPLFEKLKNFPYGERVINRLLVSYPIISDKNFFSIDSNI